jgi:hypothetical protein
MQGPPGFMTGELRSVFGIACQLEGKGYSAGNEITQRKRVIIGAKVVAIPWLAWRSGRFAFSGHKPEI